jgi:hypothetical protein
MNFVKIVSVAVVSISFVKIVLLTVTENEFRENRARVDLKHELRENRHSEDRIGAVVLYLLLYSETLRNEVERLANVCELRHALRRCVFCTSVTANYWHCLTVLFVHFS